MLLGLAIYGSFILIAAAVLWLQFSRRGLEILLGGRIVRTLDRKATATKLFGRLPQGIAVHVVQRSRTKPARVIGLELRPRSESTWRWSKTPLVLTPDEAITLADLLRDAVEQGANAT